MPTHSLLPFLDCPDGPAPELLAGNRAGVPGPGCGTAAPRSTRSDKTAFQPAAAAAPLSCMFCEQTFARQEELGPHVLAQHPTTFSEPAVLKVEAEFRIPGVRARPKPSGGGGGGVEKEEGHRCIVCGQAWRDAGELEAHLRKHKDYFTYCCRVCGRRFREPWFLKNHMRIHAKAGGRGRAQHDPEPPATINGVVQEASAPVATAYSMCMVCGFFFPDHASLAEHSRVHNREAEPRPGPGAGDRAFLGALGLRPRAGEEEGAPARTSRWIPQLNPFVTYQAWQLATKGKVAVGPNTGKEASSGNDDSGSDEAAAAAAGLPRRSLIRKAAQRPTTCEACRRTFRTYHQLVLHSRVHKREKGGDGSPSPPAATKLGRAHSPEREEEEAAPEDGSEEAAGDDGGKNRSRECGYCGKSFRSTYYLTIHLRTHTGEKPYKCDFCDYAAAQKTSLKYHLDRRHKGQSFARPPSTPTAPSPSEPKPASDDDSASASGSARWSPAVTWSAGASPEDGKADVPMEAADEGAAASGPAPDIETEQPEQDAPLDLSLKVSLSFSLGGGTAGKDVVAPLACSLCAYTSVYPEALIIHRRMVHKVQPVAGGNVKSRSSTGCPPALCGKDVPPLLQERRHPRRTKSPPPPPAKPPANPPPAPAPKPPSPAPAGAQESVQPGQDAARHAEPPRNANAASKPAADRKVPVERAGLGERAFPARGGAIWHPDAARLCLSSQFGALPQLEFGEPSNKRPRFPGETANGGGGGGGGEMSAFRGPPGDAAGRLLMAGRSLGAAPETPGVVRSARPSLGAGLDSEWGMMNLLRSYTPSDLAALYHGTPPGAAPAILAPARTAGRTVLYQHLPSLAALPRRDAAAAPLPGQRYGTADKST